MIAAFAVYLSLLALVAYDEFKVLHTASARHCPA